MLRAGQRIAFRFEVSTDHGPSYGEGTRGHDLLHLQPVAGMNEVGGEPQQFGLGVEVFHERNVIGSGIGPRRCSPPQRTTQNAAKTFGTNGRDFRNPGALAAFVAALGHRESPLETDGE